MSISRRSCGFLNCFSTSYNGNCGDLELIREYCLGSNNKKRCITDIMVKTKSGQHLLMIENKVKSCPNEVQLNIQSQYVGNCVKVLLTLFPVDNSFVRNNGFQIVNYSVLINNIRSQYSNCNSKFKQYVDDYCSMVEMLYNVIISLNFFGTKRFMFPIVFPILEDIGFLDVYRKYQASCFRAEGENALANYGVRTDCGLSNKHAIVSFYMDLTPNLTVGVQIEGNQFRIVFYGTDIRILIQQHKTKIIQLPKYITDVWDYWLGSAQKGGSKKKIVGDQYNLFGSYSEDFIYRYVFIYDNLNTASQQTNPSFVFDDLIKNGFGKQSVNGKALTILNVMEYFKNTFSCPFPKP